MNSTKYTICWNVTRQDIGDYSATKIESPPLIEAITVGILLGCVIILTIFGNITVLLAVYLDRRLRHTTNYFIVNLAAADLLLGVTVLPFSATLEVLKYWPFGNILCDLWASADVLWCTASILTLCVISIDRYIGVTRPLQHSSIITKRRAGLIIAFVWVLSGVISVGPLIGWRESNLTANECTVTKQTGYVIFSVSGSFYIPTLIIIIVYIKIYREASRHSKFLYSGSKTIKVGEDNGVILRVHTARCSQHAVPSYGGSSSSENSEGSVRKFSSRITPAGKLAKFRREKKAAKTLGIVVGVFIGCWFPFFFCLPLDVLCESCHVPEKLFTVIFWLGYCNSLMNPIIYASSSREFKRAFLKVLRCYWLLQRCKDRDDKYNLRKYCSQRKSEYCRNEKQISFSTNARLRERENSTQNTDSPVKALVVYKDRRKYSSSQLEPEQISSQGSSFSDLANAEHAILKIEEMEYVPTKSYAAIV